VVDDGSFNIYIELQYWSPNCTTAEAQQRLLAALCSLEKDMHAAGTAKMTKSQRSALLGATDDVSFGLPAYRQKEHTAHLQTQETA
jgi:hypothetical protein